MIKAIILSIVAGIGGLWVATKFIPGVTITGSFETLLIAGTVLGIIIAVIHPLLSLASFLFRILLLGALTLGILWILKSVFPELVISGFLPLVFTAAAVAGISIILSIFK